MIDRNELFKDFNGRLAGRALMQEHVLDVLVKLPQEVQGYITQKCWIVGSMDDTWAYTFTGNDLKDKHLIILSDELFSEPKENIEYTIAHEIGHVMLGHHNSTMYQQTQSEIDRQEFEADRFAMQHLRQ